MPQPLSDGEEEEDRSNGTEAYVDLSVSGPIHCGAGFPAMTLLRP